MGNKTSQPQQPITRSKANINQSNFQIKNSRTTNYNVIKLEYMISSIQLIQNQDLNYHLKLQIHTLSECYLTSYFYLIESTNSQLTTHSKFEKANSSSRVINFKCPKQDNFVIPSNYLHFNRNELITFNQLEDNNNKSHYPLVIEMQSLEQKSNLQLIYFYKVVENEDGLQIKLVNEAIYYQNGLFSIQKLFGIESTIFNNEWNPNTQQNKECVICFTQFIDTALLPCRHMCTCSQCTNHIFQSNAKQCPLCRKDINNYLQISYKNQEKLKQIQNDMEQKKKELEELQRNMIHLQPPEFSPNNIELQQVSQRGRENVLQREESKSLIDNQAQQPQNQKNQSQNNSSYQINSQPEQQYQEENKVQQDQEEVEIVIQEDNHNEENDDQLNFQHKDDGQEDQEPKIKQQSEKQENQNQNESNQKSNNDSNLIIFDE